MPETEDLYEILHLHPSAHPDVIQAAYRRLALLYHPDKNPSPEATAQMNSVNRAYEVLSDPEKRAEYDHSRAPQPVAASQETRPRRTRGTSSLDYVTIGSSKDDVARIQGPPNITSHWRDTFGSVGDKNLLDQETWTYPDFAIYFNRPGRVQGWSVFNPAVDRFSNNMDSAKIKLLPGSNATTASFFTIGSHKDDVAKLHGTPFRIIKDWDSEFVETRYIGDSYSRYFYTKEIWTYPGGTVELSLSTGRVTAHDNKDGSLKTQKEQLYQEAEWTGDDFFTLGSSKREVQRIQGKPIRTSKWIEGAEIWDYGNNNQIEFRSGRVQAWTNIGRYLKVRLVPGPTVTSRPSFSIGSHRDDVARLQESPPFSIHFHRTLDHETWLFSGGSIHFSISSGKVIYYEDKDGSLRGEGIRPSISREDALEKLREEARSANEKAGTRLGIGCAGLITVAFAFLFITGWFCN